MAAWAHVCLASAFGGLVALERRAFLQAMLARPLVASTLTGIFLGDAPSGVFVGLVLELFHLGSVSLGASIPDNETLAATGTAGFAASMAHGSGGGGTPAIWSLSILLFIGLGPLGRRLDDALGRYSARLARRALSSADKGELRRAMQQNLWGMWPHFLVSAGATALCAGLGYAAVPLLDRVPLGVLRGLAWAYPVMASVAAAIAARRVHARKGALYSGGAAALVAVVAAAYHWVKP